MLPSNDRCLQSHYLGGCCIAYFTVCKGLWVDQVHNKLVSCCQEGERSEMLDHFRSLSMEASVLESSNHSLETEVQDARIQLRVANDRITDLEHLLETKDTLVNSCERQVCVWCSSVLLLYTLFCF
jgi:hypothetical protein